MAASSSSSTIVKHVPWPETKVVWRTLPNMIKMATLTHPDTIYIRDAARQQLCETEVMVTEKMDGSNIGLDSNGTIYSRNQVVEKDVKNFGKASLDVVTKYIPSVVSLEKLILGSYHTGAHIVVFGELLCNKTKYNYGYYDLQWLVFGVSIFVPSSAYRGIPLNLWPLNSSDDKRTQDKYIILPLSPTLYKFFKKCDFEVVPLLFGGPQHSLADVLSIYNHKMHTQKEYMEGLVLHTSIGIYKWKTEKPDVPEFNKITDLLSEINES